MGAIEDMQEKFREMLAQWDKNPGQLRDDEDVEEDSDARTDR